MAETSAGFEALAEAVAGSLGGFISSAVLFPLDFVKTQQQAGTVKGSFLSVGAAILSKTERLGAARRTASWRHGPTTWLLLALAAAAATAAPSGTMGPHASGVVFKPCSAGSEAQRVRPTYPSYRWTSSPSLSQFEIPAQGETGRITDPSGRCLSVLDCALPAHQPALTAAGMGVAVLDECGAGPCGGANQQWTHTPKEAGVFELLTTLTPAASLSLRDGERGPEVEGWRLMGTFNPEIVNDERHASPRPQPAARELTVCPAAPTASWCRRSTQSPTPPSPNPPPTPSRSVPHPPGAAVVTARAARRAINVA